MSRQALGALLKEIRDDLATLPKLAAAHHDVPDALNQYPALVVYPMAGHVRMGSHANHNGKPMYWAMHTIAIELHISRKDLPRDMELAEWFCDDLWEYLLAGFKRDTFSGTMVVPGDPRMAQNSTPPIRYQMTSLQWGSDQNLGWRLEFDVTCESELEV